MSDYEFWKDLGNIFDAILHYQKKNVEFNDRFINPWIRLGNIFDRDDRNKEAVEAYRRAVDIDPASAQNWADLGDAHFKAASYDEAISAYQKAVELDPQAGWPLSNLALTLATQGRHEDAIPLYAMSIDLFTDDKDKAVTWNRLGNLYRKLNDYERAFQSFQRADELDRENTGFRDQLDENTEANAIIAPEELLDQMIVEQPAEEVAQPAAADAVTLVTVITDEVAGVEQVGILPNEEMAVAEETASTSDVTIEEIIEEPIVLQEETSAPVEESVEAPAGTESVAEQEMHTDWLPDEVEAPAAGAQENEPAATPAWLEEQLVIEDHKLVVIESLATVSEVTMDVVETYTEYVPAAETIVDAAPESVIVETETDANSNLASELEDSAQSAAESVQVSVESVTETTAQLEVKEETVVIEEETIKVDVSVVELDSVVAVEQNSLEAAYEEYLKDSTMPVHTLSDRLDEVHVEAPETKVSSNGDVRIAMDTRNAHVWNELGNVYLNSGSCEDAISAYGKAIELDRVFAWPYSNLALAYVQKGRFAEAILLYQRSIELFTSDKDKAVTWNRLGNVYRRLNDYSNAIAAYHTADQLDPENTTISLRSHYGLLGNLYAEQKTALVS